MNLREKVVVVTGASSGIGAALVRQLAKRGARVVLAARREARLEELADETALGERVLAVPVDITRHDDLERLLEATLERFGGVDALVQVAGRGATQRLDEQSPEAIEALLKTNLLGPIWLTRLFLPALRERSDAQIVLVSSMSGLVAVPLQAAYCASKAGLAGLAGSLRYELRGTSIHLLEVYPGVVDTEMIAAARPVILAHHLRVQEADAVAERLVRAMERGRQRLLPSLLDRMILGFARVFPRLAHGAIGLLLPAFEEVAAAEEEVRQQQASAGDPT